MKPLKFTAPALIAWCVLLAASANADTITEPVLDTGTLTTDFSNVPLNLQLFNSNLGTLTSVTLTVSGTMNASGTVVNEAASPESFKFVQTVAFNLTDNGGPLDPSLSALNVSPTASQTYTNLGSGDSAAFGPYAPTSSQTITGPLSAFEVAGGGTDVIDVSTMTGDEFLGGGGNIQQSIVTTGDATIQVTYMYTPIEVPEPSSVLLVGAVTLLPLLRRRRRAPK